MQVGNVNFDIKVMAPSGNILYVSIFGDKQSKKIRILPLELGFHIINFLLAGVVGMFNFTFIKMDSKSKV